MTKWLTYNLIYKLTCFLIFKCDDQVTRKKPNYSNDRLKNEHISSPIEPLLYNGAEKDDSVKHKGLQSFGYLEKFIAEKKLENITDEKPATPKYVVENSLRDIFI